MGIDLTTLLAGLTGGAQGLGTAVQQDEARKRQLALDAMNMAAHQATMDKIKADAQHQQGEDYLKGIRQGTAPSGQVFADAGRIAGGVADSMTPAAIPVARPDVQSPYQQINASSYIDRTATPDAIAQRTATAAEDRKHAQTVADEDRRVQAMIGAKLPDGTVIDERLARTMVASPQLGAAFARPPQQEPHDHYTVSNAVDAQGHPIVINTATGEEHSSTGKRPVSGQAGQASVKEKAYSDLMANAYPTMESLSGKVRPVAISLAIEHPTLGNGALSPDEQAYLNAARNFIAGALHLESGARLSKEQWAIGLQRYVPAMGDTPATIKAKTANARATLADRERLTNASSQQPPAPDVRNDAPKSDPILDKYGLTPRRP